MEMYTEKSAWLHIREPITIYAEANFYTFCLSNSLSHTTPDHCAHKVPNSTCNAQSNRVCQSNSHNLPDSISHQSANFVSNLLSTNSTTSWWHTIPNSSNSFSNSFSNSHTNCQAILISIPLPDLVPFIWSIDKAPNY
jgi:hypothetical protein